MNISYARMHEKPDQGFAGILATGLNQLAHHKLKKIDREHSYRSALGIGLDHGAAQAYSHASPEERKQILGHIGDFRRANSGIGNTSNNNGAQGGFVSENDLKKNPLDVGNDIALQKFNFLKEKEARHEQSEINKGQRVFFDKARNDYVNARSTGLKLEQQAKLIKNGKLPSSSSSAIIDALSKGAIFKIPINLESLKGASGETFDKLSAEIVSSLGQKSGGRVTNFMMENFLRSVPKLINSEEGRAKIVKQLQYFNEIDAAPYKAWEEVLKSNNNNFTQDSDLLANQVADQKIDKIIDRFNKETNTINTFFGKAEDLGTFDSDEVAKQEAISLGANAIMNDNGDVEIYDPSSQKWHIKKR